MKLFLTIHKQDHHLQASLQLGHIYLLKGSQS